MGRKIEGSGLLDTKPPRHTNQYQGASRLQHSTDPDESAANTVAPSPGPRICGAKLNCRFLLSLTIAGLHETASLPGPDPPGAIHLRGSRSDRGRHRAPLSQDRSPPFVGPPGDSGACAGRAGCLRPRQSHKPMRWPQDTILSEGPGLRLMAQPAFHPTRVWRRTPPVSIWCG